MQVAALRNPRAVDLSRNPTNLRAIPAILNRQIKHLNVENTRLANSCQTLVSKRNVLSGLHFSSTNRPLSPTLPSGISRRKNRLQHLTTYAAHSDFSACKSTSARYAATAPFVRAIYVEFARISKMGPAFRGGPCRLRSRGLYRDGSAIEGCESSSVCYECCQSILTRSFPNSLSSCSRVQFGKIGGCFPAKGQSCCETFPIRKTVPEIPVAQLRRASTAGPQSEQQPTSSEKSHVAPQTN